MELYRLTCLRSGKAYVGITNGKAIDRFRRHVWDALAGSNYPLHRAIRSYGAAGFACEVLDRLSSWAELLDAEIEAIARYGTHVRAPGGGGYNQTKGGEGTIGLEFSTKRRAAISAAGRRRVHGPETRAKMAAVRRGKPHPVIRRKPVSHETRAKISAALMGHVGSWRGKKRPPMSEAGRANMSLAKIGKKLGPMSAATKTKISMVRRGLLPSSGRYQRKQPPNAAASTETSVHGR